MLAVRRMIRPVHALKRSVINPLRIDPNTVAEVLSQMTVLNDYGAPTFARASTAYDPFARRTEASGVRRRRKFLLGGVRTITADLCEISRTNLFLRSQDHNNASWTKTDTTVTNGQAVATDGTSTLDLCAEGSAGTASVRQNPTITANIPVATSHYVKYRDTPIIRLAISNGSDSLAAWFNIQTGTKLSTALGGTSSGITSLMVEEPVGSGIYRIELAGLVNAAGTTAACFIHTAAADASTTRVTNGSYYCGWSQCEQGVASATSGLATSYIPTTSATVTRAADVLTVPYPLTTAGTILAYVIPYGWTGDQDGFTNYQIWRADDAAPSRGTRASATTLSLIRGDGGGSETTTPTVALVNQSLLTVAQTWDATAVTGFVNGLAAGTPDTTLTPPYTTNNTLVRIGNNGTGSIFNGWVALLAAPSARIAREFLAIQNLYPVAAAA